MIKLISLFPLFFFCIIAHAQLNKNDVETFVPAPWTPLQIKQNNQTVEIECWGRKYVFDNSFLPSQVYVQGIPVLSKPINVAISYKEKDLQFSPSAIQLISKSGESIDLTTTSKSNNAFGTIVLTAKIHVEYDGMMLITLKTNYPVGFNPDSFSLEISYNKNIARCYLGYPAQADAKYADAFASNNGLLFQSKFIPYLWIGDDYRGLFWFCESPQNWPIAQRQNAIEITRKENELVEKFNLGSIDTYQFGMQATPVKPLPANWRKLRFAPAVNSNIIIPWPKPGDSSSTRYFGWPEAVNDNKYTNLIKYYHAKNKMVLAYATITMIPSKLPLYQQNKNNWARGVKSFKLKEDSLIYINPNSKNYQQTIAVNLSMFLKKYNLDGYYLDGTKPYPYINNNQTNYPILAYRELQKKLYDSIKSKNPQALIIGHMSQYMNIPVLSFVDAYVDGEQFRTALNGKQVYKVKDSYLDVMNLNQFRAEFTGKQWGIIPVFLPEFDPATTNDVQPTLGLASLLLLHDVQPWPVFSNIAVWNNMYKALDSFGFENSSFKAYYDDNPPGIATGLKDVYVSAYIKTNQALVIISNLSKTNKRGNIELNNAVLGLPKINNVFSLTDSSKVNITQNTIFVNLAPLSYQLFLVK